MKKLAAILGAALIGMAMVGIAMAQAVNDTTVKIPIGTYADYILPTVAALALAAAIWGVSKLPIPSVIKTLLTEQFLKGAIGWATNMVQGAAKDKVLEVDVGNAVVKQAADYFIKYAPGWMDKYLGGVEGFRDRVIARLEIAPKAGMAPDAVIMGATAVPGTIPTASAPK